jgi:hypothetical protein
MPRPFVVIGESVAIMPYRSHGFLEIDKVDRGNFFCGDIAVLLTKNRIERVLREDVLDVRDEQFLMLLFVMEAEDEERLDLIEQLFVCI